ncbi:uncharacterized protein LTR77_009046 [Saxophila tyrrhenica]|uniref:Rhodopsin domain-containing protein n=1 Tax=Saxophila tyrrhenica TaxID=1690608 RepID=A0AAV9P3C2_9PEZI|nr:hypothetical protein LTR77_009046 [Saxophila tyrrhenica]
MFIRTRIHGPLSWDNFFCSLSTCLALAHSCLTIVATRHGLGHRLDTLKPSTVNLQRLLAWSNNQIYIGTLAFSMLSVCFLIARVSKQTEQARFAYIIAGLTTLWAVICMPVLALECDLPRPWITSPRSRCTNIYHVWIAVTITKTLLEVANVLAAVKLLWGVRMPWKAKVAVVAAFTIRLLVIPPGLTRLRYIRQTLHSQDWSYSRIRVVIITQVVLHVSVILATVPCIKPWLVAFESGGLQPHPDVRKESHAPRRTPLPSPLLPLPATARSRTTTLTRSTSLEFPARPKLLHRSASHDPDVMTPGPAGHRKRVEAWPVKTYQTQATYSVTAEYVPDPEQVGGRKKSASSVRSDGITRTKLFSVQHDEIQDYFLTSEAEQVTPSTLEEGTVETVPSLPLEVVGGLLRDDARGSRGTVQTLRGL